MSPPNITTLYLNGSATAHDNVLDMLGNKITNLQSAPTLGTDAANKAYVDLQIQTITGMSSENMMTIQQLKDLVEQYDQTDEAQIQAEIARAVAAELVLTNNLASEASTARAAELLLTNNLASESARAVASEVDLSNNIWTEYERAVAAELVLTNNLSAEASTARAAELVLTNNLSAESARAIAAEGVLTTELSDEVARAIAAEGVLTTELSDEVARAVAAEGVLTTELSDEIARAIAAENTIVSNANAALDTAKADIQVKTDFLKEAAVRIYKQLYNIDISAYTLISELPTFTYTQQ